MRSRLVLLTLLPLALAACGGGGGTTATTTPTTTTVPAKQSTSLTIKVISVVSSTKAHDRGPKGTSTGDTVVFKDVLINAGSTQFGKGATERVGTDTGTMTFTSKNTARMDGSAVLPDGTITF